MKTFAVPPFDNPVLPFRFSVLLVVCAAVATAGGWLLHDYAQPNSSHAVPSSGLSTAPGEREVNLLVFGDWGYGKWRSAQYQVADQMAAYARKNKVRFDAAFLAGDNFYGELRMGASDPRWIKEFEQPLAASFFMPFYVALGNHDYKRRTLAAEFEYGRNNSHWRLPAKWYAVNFPEKDPFVTVLVLDSNSSRLSPEDRESQQQWLAAELARAETRPWVVAVAHHPLFSNGRNGDSPQLVQDWGPEFKKRGLDFYVCGHDHGLQHLEVQGWSTTFLVSGGGGAKLQPMRRDDRGPFSSSAHGFLHLQLNTNQMVGRFISVDGVILHEFARPVSGNVSVLQTVGRDKPDRIHAGRDED